MVVAFAPKSVKAERVDPLHWCDRELRGAVSELTFMVNEAANANDIASVLNAQRIAEEIRTALQGVELLALHLADGLLERK